MNAKTRRDIKTLLLPIILWIFGFVELLTDFLTMFAQELEIPAKAVTFAKVTMFFLTALLTKMKAEKIAKRE